MTELILDASVVLKWLVPGAESGTAAARELRRTYEGGGLVVIAPSLLFLELVNVAGRRFGWADAALLELAHSLDDLGFDVREPELSAVAAWTARGLTAYDAAYVALAEEWSVELVTDDEEILRLAPDLARPLVLST